VHYQLPILLTPGEILHANNIGVLPLEDINPGTVTLNLNAVVRNPEREDKKPNHNFHCQKCIYEKANDGEVKEAKYILNDYSKRVQSMDMDFSDSEKGNLIVSKQFKLKNKKWMNRNDFKNEKNKHGIVNLSPNFQDFETIDKANKISKFSKPKSIKNLKFLNKKNKHKWTLQLKNNYSFNYAKNKIHSLSRRRKKKSFKFKRQNSFSKNRNYKEQENKSAHRIYDHEYSIQEEDSKENSPQMDKEKSAFHFSGTKEDDRFSIEPQISISKMPQKRKNLVNHFLKPIPSTMSIKSSNPILKKLNKKDKSKTLKKTELFRETYGLKEETGVLDSNKSVKFSDKDASQSKRDLFNISDNKSRLSNFSADLFPSNSNFTYDVNKIKQNFRTKNEIYNDKLKNPESFQDETRSQSKPYKIKKKSMVIQRNLQKFIPENQSEDDFIKEDKEAKFEDSNKYQKVIYNTNQISNNQFNIINMTLSVHGDNYSAKGVNKAQFIVSQEHHDSYEYSKNSIKR
jgi:hypothetical protein